MEFIKPERAIRYTLRQVAFNYDINDRLLYKYIQNFKIPKIVGVAGSKYFIENNGLKRLELCLTLMRVSGMNIKCIGKLSNKDITELINKL